MDENLLDKRSGLSLALDARQARLSSDRRCLGRDVSELAITERDLNAHAGDRRRTRAMDMAFDVHAAAGRIGIGDKMGMFPRTFPRQSSNAARNAFEAPYPDAARIRCLP